VTSDPHGLLGAWSVEAAGEEPGMVVLLDPSYLLLRRQCGTLLGKWRAHPTGPFVARIWSGSTACFDRARPETWNPRWLRSAAQFRLETAGPVLVDGRGEVTARLEPYDGPDGPRPLFPPKDLSMAPDPFADPAPLPVGLRPAAATELVDRWHPVPLGVRRHRAPPHLVLTAERRWSCSDGPLGAASATPTEDGRVPSGPGRRARGRPHGCGGVWLAGEAGLLLAITGPSTFAFDGPHAGGWMYDVARAGFDGEVLVLHDRDGRPLGRLARG
jgi:hypothetical protein